MNSPGVVNFFRGKRPRARACARNTNSKLGRSLEWLSPLCPDLISLFLSSQSQPSPGLSLCLEGTGRPGGAGPGRGLGG